MEIRLIKKAGVPAAEIDAHQRIHKAFNESQFSSRWRGYASFKLARGGRGSGDDDFDLVLVTHTNVVVIELKNWHGKNLKKVGENWFLDGEDRGESPVSIVNLKAKKLANLMKQKLGNDKTPFVNSFVVIQDGVEELEMGDDDQAVLYLYELLEWVDQDKYKKSLPWAPRFNVLANLGAYDRFFCGNDFKPRDYLVQGFRPGDVAIWEHPKGLYSEFRAQAKDDPDQLALLRRWNFGALGMTLIGEGDRAFLGLREQRIYEYVSDRNPELGASLLRPIGRKDAKDVTFNFEELYSLPSKLARLTEFSNSVLPKLDPDERVRLVKALLIRFADLHDLSVAHRDVGDHCLWIERPARVVVTGFPAAYYPSMKTVGTFREQIRVDRSNLPEDVGTASESTPYRRDIFLLGVICYLILYGARPPRVNNVHEWASRADDQFEGAFDAVLSKALASNPLQRFENARAMLEAVNAATSSESHQIIDLTRFEAFKAVSKLRDYEETDVLRDDDDVLFFRSKTDQHDLAVKCWNGVEPDPLRQDDSIRLLAFVERARTLRGCAIPGLPRIVDFGLSRKNLLLVREWVDGQTLYEWLASTPDLEARLRVARALADVIVRLHALELPHGDVHPGNVIVVSSSQSVLIDALDFEHAPGDAYTTAYLPPEYKTMSPVERDRYGLAAVICEMLGGNQAQPQGPYSIPKVYDQLSRLLTEHAASALEPLQQALAAALRSPEQETVSVTVTVPNLAFRSVPQGPMYLDNGRLHVKVEDSKKAKGCVFFRLTAVGRQLTFDWSLQEEKATNIRAENITQVQLMRSQTMHDAVITSLVSLKDGSVGDVSDLVQQLLGIPEVQNKIRVLTEQRVDITRISEPAPGAARRPIEDLPSARALLPIAVSDLWRVLLDAEEDALPSLTVSGEHRHSPYERNQTLVPYQVDSGVIDYSDAETVIVEVRGNDGNWRNCGYLSLRDTTFGERAELAIQDLSSKTNLRIGDKLRLRGTLEKASFTRRSLAVQRVLSDRAVIPGLIEYFDPSAGHDHQPTTYRPPSDIDLEEYAEGDKKLNESQRDAFRRVVGNGPISLLQGPPGTGKTWFIASLLHYLMTKEQARRILLVSQSHEAVNNALEKSLELCRSKGLQFDAVRLGSESAASDAIRHLHSSSIEYSYREQFKAEKKPRTIELAKAMGLPEDFANSFIELWHRLGGLANRINELTRELQSNSSGEDQGDLEARVRALTSTFEDICRDVYEASCEATPDQTLSKLEQQFVEQYEIRSPDAVQRLGKLIRLSEDWLASLGSPEANFAEFLAKSRTVVAGTLVGIGHRASGVVQNLYDWVVIDEAGRAAPSELAVAMQTGHRILLVGDHKQLPPTFSEEVRDIIKSRFSVGDESPAFGSDFERIYESAYGKTVGASLLKQYRMAPDIGKLVSDCFYDGRLETGRAAPSAYYDKLPDHMRQQVTWVDTSPLGPSGFEQSTKAGDQRWNDTEARVVMRLLRQIIECDDFMEEVRSELQPSEPAIGIICMYSRQRDVLNRMKSEASWLGDLRRLVKIDTVDSYQGKENRIVILSTVRNNAALKPGFLRVPNRINVALSRAMDRLFVVGASRMWAGRNAQLPLGAVFAKVQSMQQEGRAEVLSAKELLQ
mgnify:CR=1 FL=1